MDYAQNLMTLLGNSWRPDLKRLEQLDKFEQMQRIDYQEAWAWVHFMLHSSPDTRDILIGYLNDLETDPHPTPLYVRLEQNGAAGGGSVYELHRHAPHHAVADGIRPREIPAFAPTAHDSLKHPEEPRTQ